MRLYQGEFELSTIERSQKVSSRKQGNKDTLSSFDCIVLNNVCVWVGGCMCACMHVCVCILLLLNIFLVFEQFLAPCFIELLMFYCEFY